MQDASAFENPSTSFPTFWAVAKRPTFLAIRIDHRKLLCAPARCELESLGPKPISLTAVAARPKSCPPNQILLNPAEIGRSMLRPYNRPPRLLRVKLDDQ